MPPTLAEMVPVPTAPALNQVGLPGFGENEPSAGETDQLGVTATALP